jgi:DNA-binding transcriptional LysR family regulator
VDLDTVRTFVAAADAGQFQEAAIDLSLTQQAVSKRVAALEKHLGVRLFTRTARGAKLTVDGQAFLPHARDLLRAEDRAMASIRPSSRALRVDVLGRRLSLAALLRDFHRAHPEIELDIVTLFGADAAIAAVQSGMIDATFRAVTMPDRRLPDGIVTTRILDERLRLIVGPAHEFATAGAVTLADLAGLRIWMPGHVAGTEWFAYYEDLAATAGFAIDAFGPNFGVDAQMEAIAESTDLSTLVGDESWALWRIDHNLRRVAVNAPTPVYPHSLVWRRDNPHPALAVLRDFLGSIRPTTDTWTPKWVLTA